MTRIRARLFSRNRVKEMNTSMNLSQSARNAAFVSVMAGIAILLLKFYAFAVTGSNAILSDALESIVNVVTSSFALFTIYLGASAADEDHNYGHGKAEFFSAGLEGGLIFLAGGVILGHALWDIYMGNHDLRQLDFGLVLIITASVGNGLLGWFLIRRSRKLRSPALAADGAHILTDFYTSAGLILGVAAIWQTGWVWLDSVIASVIGLFLLYNGMSVLNNSIHGLMDGVSSETMESVVSAIEKSRTDSLIRPHRMRVRESGPVLLLDIHIIIPNYFTVRQWHDSEVDFSDKISHILNRQVDLMMHEDPCIPEDCRFCRMKKCKVRSESQKDDYVWTKEFLLTDVRHTFYD
jgi:cation diffusion facilitator family transporter